MQFPLTAHKRFNSEHHKKRLKSRELWSLLMFKFRLYILNVYLRKRSLTENKRKVEVSGREWNWRLAGLPKLLGQVSGRVNGSEGAGAMGRSQPILIPLATRPRAFEAFSVLLLGKPLPLTSAWLLYSLAPSLLSPLEPFPPTKKKHGVPLNELLDFMTWWPALKSSGYRLNTWDAQSATPIIFLPKMVFEFLVVGAQSCATPESAWILRVPPTPDSEASRDLERTFPDLLGVCWARNIPVGCKQIEISALTGQPTLSLSPSLPQAPSVWFFGLKLSS